MTTSTMLAGDVEVVRRVLAHIDAGTTDEGEAWREPVANYLDPDRFAAELRLLRSLPSVFAPSAAIPGSGDHVERVAFGVPLFAVRDRDGRARVFRNSCRHRGVAPSTARSRTSRTRTASPTSTRPGAGWSRWPAPRSTG
jgi:hypothetical protein